MSLAVKAYEPDLGFIWVIVIPASLLGGWIVRMVWSHIGKHAQYGLLGVFFMLMTITTITVFTPWSLRGYWPQSFSLILGCIAATCVGFLSLQRKTRSDAFLAVRGLGLLAVLFVFYGLWCAHWRSNTNEDQTPISGDVVLRRSAGGWGGQYWEGVTLVQQPKRFPFLERTLYSVNIGDAGDCDQSSVNVAQDPISREIVVQCGRKSPYVWARIKIP
jgi:hypothetical protein